MIAIHHVDNSYSVRWADYCRTRNIPYIIVNIYETDIMNTIREKKIKYLLAHLSHGDYKTSLIAKPILSFIQKSGVKVYPDFNTIYTFDDKITQKYLFESLSIPHAKMNVFYSKDDALDWISNSLYPFVFKLKGGAGSSNVHLIRNKREAFHYIDRIFGIGFKPIRSALSDLNTKLYIHTLRKDKWDTFIKLPLTLKNIITINKQMERQKGYFLVQEFLPNNSFDTRVVVVGEKAFAFRRFTRPNDFRASGSKNVDLSQDKIDKRALALSFEASDRINAQSMAYDILFDQYDNPKIIEMSCYCPSETVSRIKGYWDSSLHFHNEEVRLEDEIINNLIG